MRWTLNNDRSFTRSKSTGRKHATALQPPKQVIRATADFSSSSPCELSFQKGDFFHVLSDDAVSPPLGWYKACNPLTNARGLVPAHLFDVLQRSSPSSAVTLNCRSELNPNGTVAVPLQADTVVQSIPSTQPRSPGVYGTVKHDFEAELPQELSVKAGESIVILAHSNFEWYVAKSLVRLASSGLVPATFVDVYDPKTGELISNNGHIKDDGIIPSLSQWKRTNERLQQSAIPLGQIPLETQETAQSTAAERSKPGKPLPESPPRVRGSSPSLRSNSNDSILPAGILVSATIDAIHVDTNDLWYRIRATYVSPLYLESVPEVNHAQEARELILLRMYEDFYDFHVALMNKMPIELGLSRRDVAPLIPGLPPRPENNDDNTTAAHRLEMDHYLRALCLVSEPILKSTIVRAFFEPRYEDSCATSYPRAISGTIPNEGTEDSALGASFSFANSTSSWSNCQSASAKDNDLVRRMSGMRTGSVGSESANEHSMRDSIDSNKQRAPQEHLCHIKVIRRSTPDLLVVLRVTPSSCSYLHLLTKVQAKLGSDIRQLRMNSDMMRKPVNDMDLQKLVHSSLTAGRKVLLYADT